VALCFSGNKLIDIQVIFTENNRSYSLQVNSLSSTEELNKGLWLVIAGVNDIPPHIALIDDGKYYSVSARKVKVAEPVDKFLKAIGRNSLPTLFVGIKQGNQSPQMGGLRGAEAAFQRYPVLGNGDHTCHWPIRDFFVETFSPEFASGDLVFELLAIAQKQGLLTECKSLYVKSNSSVITLPKYTNEQIKERINSILKINE